MKLLSKIQPKIVPKIIQKVFDGAIAGLGLKYPPVRDKLLIWANGQIQDGAYVWQDPDEVQDPDAPFGIWRKDKQITPVEYSMKSSSSHCLYMTAGETISCPGHTTLTSSGGTAELSYDNLDIVVVSSGTIFNIIFSDGCHFPCSEGSGSEVYCPSNPGYSGSPSVVDWSHHQDDYHYNVAKGFWMNGDGVKYPYPVSGFTSVHPAGKWNGAESKYQLRNEPVLVTSDLLETTGFWFSGHLTTPVEIPRTQTEIEAHCLGKGSEFFCEGRGLKKYDEVLKGDELYYALLDCGSAEAVTDDGEVVTDADTGEIIYERI